MSQPERALLVGVRLPARFGGSSPERMAELAELARSAGAEVLASVEQRRDRPDPATLIGRGKLEELRQRAEDAGADLLIFDHDLTPTQLRNLSLADGPRVIDRTQLILDIFSRRARTREGQLQVELAQLNYLLPRLTGKGIALSRLGAGIGTRGPGETKLETDRRRIRRRVQKLQEELEAVRRRRAQQRQTRKSSTIALVGYTNAGKSTLFNTLTRAEVEVSRKLFATLDPTVRTLALPSGRSVLVSDTVGFIRDLPPGLIAAFRATLEEVTQAALILCVSDVADPEHDEKRAEVLRVLADLGVESVPRLDVFNKTDLLGEEERRELKSAPGIVFVSALRGWGLEELTRQIDTRLDSDRPVRLTLRLKPAAGRERALIHEHGRVLQERFRDGNLWIEVDLPESIARELRRFAVRA